MPTPHISAQKGDFAKTVLFPGDPLRAKFIAENFLDNAKEVTSVRNVLGYTGTYKGKKVSVIASGMGIPSCSIYAKELITEYGVKNIIRVGTAGGLKGSKINDIILAIGASTDSNVNRQRLNGFDFSATANFDLLSKAHQASKKLNINVKVGNCFSADLFYVPDMKVFDIIENMNIACVEMEAAGLYGVAAEYNANALAILTISDHIRTGESLTSQERQTTLKDMINIALETIE